MRQCSFKVIYYLYRPIPCLQMITLLLIFSLQSMTRGGDDEYYMSTRMDKYYGFDYHVPQKVDIRANTSVYVM